MCSNPEDREIRVYQIRIQGQLHAHWANWIASEPVWFQEAVGGSTETIIRIRVPDQAALRGALNRIWDLNLTILSLDLCQPEN